MTFKLLMLTFNIPREIQRNIQKYMIEKKTFKDVLIELELRYNSGLWWLYQIPNVETYDCYGEFIDTISKVTFTTLNQDEDICNQAILHEEVLDVIKFKQNLMGVLGFGY